MLKWIWCLLWGHDIEKNDHVKRTFVDDENNTTFHYAFWCKRCKKYRRV